MEPITQKIISGRECPYIGTIKRHMLDFDFEKVCSISLSNLNIYACLVCGIYYQGRGKSTNAYSHSLEEDHHLFINLQDQRIICLPDEYEVQDKSLSDIMFNLKPVFTNEEIQLLDSRKTFSRGINGEEYLPGCVGLNNIKKTDYANVIIQALCRVKKLRNFLIMYEDLDSDIKFDLVGLFIQRMAELLRKIWNPKNFKSHISPHEVMQAIDLASNNKFKITEQSDSINFLSWFLNTVHEYLKKKYKTRETVISKTFQGELLVEVFTLIKDMSEIGPSDKIVTIDGLNYRYDKKKQNFFYLTLDLPNTPLFKDSSEKINIPQISIYELLKKYNGKHYTEDPAKGIKRRYQILRLPKNLVLYFKRFEKNLFFVEKNPTIVNFPIKNLSFEETCDEETINREYKYSLLANIIHDGKPMKGTFRAQVKHKGLDMWFDIQDLNVVKIMAQSVVVSESYIHVYEHVKQENDNEANSIFPIDKSIIEENKK